MLKYKKIQIVGARAVDGFFIAMSAKNEMDCFSGSKQGYKI